MTAGGGLLDRPGDEPAPREEAAIERLNRKDAKALRQALFALENSRVRYLAYEKCYSLPDCAMERRVQDRNLDVFLTLRPSIKQMPIEEAIRRAEECGRG